MTQHDCPNVTVKAVQVIFKVRSYHFCAEFSHLALVSLCLKLHTNSHQKFNLDYSHKAAFMKDEHTDLHMLQYASRAAGDATRCQHPCIHVQAQTHFLVPPIPKISEWSKTLLQIMIDNDKQCVKLHIIDKTKQKGSFNLWCISKQWLVNGKMNFFFLVSRQSLRYHGWPQTHYVVEDDFDCLLLLPPSPEYWDCRHVLSHLAYSVLMTQLLLGLFYAR